MVFECKLKKGVVGALPFQAYRARPKWIYPHPSEKSSGCTGFNIDPPEPKLSGTLLAGLGGVDDSGEWKCFGSLRIMRKLFGLGCISVTHALKTIPSTYCHF